MIPDHSEYNINRTGPVNKSGHNALRQMSITTYISTSTQKDKNSEKSNKATKTHKNKICNPSLKYNQRFIQPTITEFMPNLSTKPTSLSRAFSSPSPNIIPTEATTPVKSNAPAGMWTNNIYTCATNLLPHYSTLLLHTDDKSLQNQFPSTSRKKQRKITHHFNAIRNSLHAQSPLATSDPSSHSSIHQQTPHFDSPCSPVVQLDPLSLKSPSCLLPQQIWNSDPHEKSEEEHIEMHVGSPSLGTLSIATTNGSPRSALPPVGRETDVQWQALHPLHQHAGVQQVTTSDYHTTGILTSPPNPYFDSHKRPTNASRQISLPQWRQLHLAQVEQTHDVSDHTLQISLVDSPSSRQSMIRDKSQSPTEQKKIEATLPESNCRKSKKQRYGYQKYLLRYTDLPNTQKRISYFQCAAPTYGLHDAWGHSLESIDASTTFRIFLQNPNGLALYDSNFSLMQDLDTCSKYGAAVISLPETNVNWDSPGQKSVFSNLLSRTWEHVSVATSRASESFHSSYQPGGTATVVSNNWTSRVINKGSDPHGLGRWSYVILRGKGTTRVAIITAYNVSQHYQSNIGERTAYKQQYRLLSQIIRDNNLQIAPHPHRQFILDLQSWIEHLISTGHEIILALDANEPYNPDITVGQHPLTYNSGCLTQAKSHDGKLSTLIATCGLKDPLASQHPERPFPASYFRGKNRIDYILVTPRLSSAVLRTGSLPLYSLFQGDHRPYYVDLDAMIAFADNAYEIARPQGRGLQLKDPRIVGKYTSELYQQLEYHKIWDKETTLKQAATTQEWTAEHTEQYHRTDKLIMESMLRAERKAGRRCSTRFEWSPALKQAVQQYRFWKLKLKQVRGLKVSSVVLAKYHGEANLTDQVLSQTFSEAEIVKSLQVAYKNMVCHQKNHRQLRASYLESLAEAIVLHRSPLLNRPGAESIKQEHMLKQIRKLQKREQFRRMYSNIGHTLHTGVTEGLNRVDIPDDRAVGSDLGSPDDPKHWKGPWHSISHPEEISRIICNINKKQYNQAWETPFGSGPLANTIGCFADTPEAKALLDGTLPADILFSLMPETIRILQTLATPIQAAQLNQTSGISEEEFVATYKLAQEATSSSPSGRHVGHYKAILTDPNLVSLHTTMMSIPFQVGLTPDRWSRVTDIMLEKERGNARCHRLHILALFESDFNHAKRIIIARKVGHHLEDNKLAPNMQFGSRPGRNCHSAVLHKVLSHDIVRLNRSTAAFIENDAVGCYDRLMNNLLLLILLRLGMPDTVTTCMGKIWDQTVHHIKTVYGTSTSTYYSTPQTPLFGPGQGSTCGPIFWLLCFCLIVDSIDPKISAAMFVSVCSTMVISTLGAAFVDDSSLSVTSTYKSNPDISMAQNTTEEISHTVQNLTILSQHWERLLFSTGGAINMQKSFWYLIAWTWRNGQPKLITSAKIHDKLTLTSGYSDQKQTVPQLDSKESFRTLGIFLSPSGSQTKQARILRQYAETYKTQIMSSNLDPQAAYCSHIQYLCPRLIYPLPCASLTQKQCRHIQAPALAALLPKLHLNRQTPHVILFGEPRFGGLNLPDLYTDQGYGQLRLLLGHLHMQDDTGKLILIAISHLQLHVGSATPFFALPYPHFAQWIDHNWLTSIWKHTAQLRMQVEVEHHWLPNSIREHDILLMDLFLTLNFHPSQVQLINSCRLFLQVLSLSDITSANGKHILSHYMQGTLPQERISTLKWPKQQRPPAAAWKLWQLALAHISTNGLLHQKLGNWTGQPHQRWSWFRHSSQELVYRLGPDDEWQEFHPVTPAAPSQRVTRQTKVWYTLNRSHAVSPTVSELLPTTIYQDPLFDDDLFYDSPSSTAFPTVIHPTANSVWDLDNSLHILADTPAFHQRLLGPLPPLGEQDGMTIAHQLELETLLACSDGSYYQESHTGSHGWVLASTEKKVLLQGAGPDDCHPFLMSSYRSELGGLLAVLYMIYRICLHYQVTSGKMKYFCDNKGVIANVFSPTAPGIAPYLQADADLVMEAKRLLSIIPVTVLAEWVKGHYTGKDKEYKHDLNEAADKLATSFNSSPHPHFLPGTHPLTPPAYGARILYDGSTITNKLRQLMEMSLHRKPFISYIMKKNQWNEATFHLVHWDGHEMAFKRLTRFRKLTVAKLIHGLANTNVQNQRYYKTLPICPCCSSADETFAHVLSCSAENSNQHREMALQELQKDLKSISTPLEVIDTITYGFQMWIARQIDPDKDVHAPTAGSLRGTDMLLTMAFNEQFHTIGWKQMFHGRLSKLWGRVVSELRQSLHSSFSTTWTAQTVLYLWKFTQSLWNHRNKVVHGGTDLEIATKIKEAAHTQVRNLYILFQSNPNFILSRHHHLFTSRTLDQRLKLDIDSITCWLRSFDDAKKALEYHNTSLRLQSHPYFEPFYAIGRARAGIPSSSSDSTYSVSSSGNLSLLEDSTSLDSIHSHMDNITVSTTTTTDSLDSHDLSSSTFSSGTFISTGSNDPPSIVSWSTSSEQH